MAEAKLKDLAMAFSVQVIKLCENIQGHEALVSSLERASAAVGLAVHEAQFAQSKADFIAKLQEAHKACCETEYWIELFTKAEFTPRASVDPLFRQCGVIRRVLIAMINTAKHRDFEKGRRFPGSESGTRIQ